MRVLCFVAVLLAAGGVSACGGSSSETETTAQTQEPTRQEPSPTEDPTRQEPSASETRPTPSISTASVPDVTGERLSVAEARLSDVGLDRIRLVDATGQERVVLNTQNWIVRSQTPAANTVVDLDTTIELNVIRPSDDARMPNVVAGTVPNVVCQSLQDAQDLLQDAGFTRLDSHDGTGQGRQQVLDQNWVVIEQSIPANTRPAENTTITLTVVKFGEPTGDSGCAS